MILILCCGIDGTITKIQKNLFRKLFKGNSLMTITINKLKEYGLQPVLTPSGIDILAPERVDIPVGQHYTVGSGVGLDIPEGYVGIIYPRSKMALKRKIKSMHKLFIMIIKMKFKLICIIVEKTY